MWMTFDLYWSLVWNLFDKLKSNSLCWLLSDILWVKIEFDSKAYNIHTDIAHQPFTLDFNDTRMNDGLIYVPFDIYFIFGNRRVM
jgi:hypothetical protein